MSRSELYLQFLVSWFENVIPSSKQVNSGKSVSPVLQKQNYVNMFEQLKVSHHFFFWEVAVLFLSIYTQT